MATGLRGATSITRPVQRNEDFQISGKRSTPMLQSLKSAQGIGVFAITDVYYVAPMSPFPDTPGDAVGTPNIHHVVEIPVQASHRRLPTAGPE